MKKNNDFRLTEIESSFSNSLQENPNFSSTTRKFEQDKNLDENHTEEVLEAELIDPSAKNSHIDEKQASKTKKIIYEIFDFLKIFFVALALWFIINSYFLEVNLVVGRSMYPTLQDKDRIIVNKIAKFWRPYQRGDIVTIDGQLLPYYHTDKFLVKRIIGLPGETVRIEKDKVFINDELLSEIYLGEDIHTDSMGGDFATLKLEEDEYYVLGDNREYSGDSRTMGPVPIKAIKGYLIFRIYPFKRIGIVD